MARLATIDPSQTSIHTIRAGVVPPYELTQSEVASLRSEGKRLRKAAEQHLFVVLSCAAFSQLPQRTASPTAPAAQPDRRTDSVASRFGLAARAAASPKASARLAQPGSGQNTHAGDDLDVAASTTAVIRGWAGAERAGLYNGGTALERGAVQEVANAFDVGAVSRSREASPVAMLSGPYLKQAATDNLAQQHTRRASTGASTRTPRLSSSAPQRYKLPADESSELTVSPGMRPSTRQRQHTYATQNAQISRAAGSGTLPGDGLEARLQKIQQSLAAVRAR
jgi:hypothetical protein